MRIGIGYDIHKLEHGREFILGGVKIPFDKGFAGHSDGDVLLHAITDAILGALGEDDIGTQFPDNDPQYKGANSLKLLETIKEKSNFKIINLDCNIICEQPKMKPYIAQMKENIARVLKISEKQIGIKAKTNEGLDAVGEGKAVCAQCIVLLES